MFVVILAPDAGNFWAMSTENSMNHKHHFFHATRFRFFATAFEYETIRRRQERKQRRPNSKMHKTSPVKAPLLVAINREVLQKNYKKMGCKQKKTYKMVGFVYQPALCSTPTFCRDVYLPGCLIFILFWVWSLLACLDPNPKKKHHFVRTCCAAISLRFYHLSLRGNPSFLKRNGFNDICGLFFFTMLTKKMKVFMPLLSLLLLPKRCVGKPGWHGQMAWCCISRS